MRPGNTSDTSFLQKMNQAVASHAHYQGHDTGSQSQRRKIARDVNTSLHSIAVLLRCDKFYSSYKHLTIVYYIQLKQGCQRQNVVRQHLHFKHEHLFLRNSACVIMLVTSRTTSRDSSTKTTTCSSETLNRFVELFIQKNIQRSYFKAYLLLGFK